MFFDFALNLRWACSTEMKFEFGGFATWAGLTLLGVWTPFDGPLYFPGIHAQQD